MLCYINVTLWVRRYIITCLCPNLVSVPFYTIPIFPFKFPKFLFTCLPSFFCLSEAIFYKIYMVYRDVITMLIYGFTTISIFTFSEAFVGEIQHCLPEAICCYITLFTEILSQS